MTGTQTTPAGFDEAFERFRAGDFDSARELLRRCVADAPAHVGSLVGLAVCERQLGALHEAESLLRQAVEYDGTHVQARYMLGKVLAEQGRTDEAVEQWRRTLSIDPAHAGAAQELAGHDGPPTAQIVMTSPDATPKGTLAETVDDPEAPLDALRAGALLFQGHRRVLSHRRFWLGVPIAALGLLLLRWARRIDDAAPGSKVVIVIGPAGPQRQVDDTVRTLARIAADIVRYLGWTAMIVGVLAVAAAFVNAALSNYVIRERRIEITEGVFRRVRRIIWLYRIHDVRVVQNLPMLLSGTARLTIHHEDPAGNPATRVGWWLRPAASITGVASTAQMIRLMEDIQRRSIVERRAMKKAFI
jgi:hypothetical protein